MHLRRVIAASLLVLSQAAAVPPVSAADAPSTTVRVGVYDNAPKVYRDGAGVIRGFWADITDAIAQQEGWDLVYVHDTWEGNLARLASGQIDLMVDVAYSDERSRLYDFTGETVLLGWGLFYTRAGVTLGSIQDLQGTRIAVLESGILYAGPLGLVDILDASGVTADIIGVREYDDVFELLDSGQADAGVVNWYFGFAEEGKYDVQRSNILFQPTDLKFAMPKGAAANAYLTATIDRYIRQMRADHASVYHESIRKNFGAFVEKEHVIPPWVRYLIAALGALLLVTVADTLILRRYKRSLERRVAADAAEIRARTQQLEIIYGNVADVVFYITVEAPGVYRFAHVNDAFTRVTGLPMEAIANKLVTEVIPPASLPTVLDHYAQAIRERRRLQWLEVSAYPTGTKHGEVSVTPIFDGDRCTALVGTVHDITERVVQEESLKLANARIADLHRAKNEFVSVATHQLKAPISVILGYASVFQEETSADVRREAMDAITRGVREMNDLIGFLSKITHAESGQLRFALEPVDLGELTRDVVGLLDGELHARNQRVEVVQEPSVFPAVSLDRETAKQVIVNLLSNATRYGNADSVIRVRMNARPGAVEYAVTNRGIGIPDSAKPRIFERFFRADNARAAVPEGTGLGLALAKSFVQALGGNIRFESQEGGETTFAFTVPNVAM